MQECFNAAIYIVLICVTSLFVLWTISLAKVIRGSPYKFLIIVIALLMVSNLSKMVEMFATGYYCVSDYKSNSWSVTKWLTSSIQIGTYTMAHWLVASKYNQIASEVPYLLHEVSIPASQKTCHRRMFWIFFSLIGLFACFQSVLGIPYNKATYIKPDGEPAYNLRNGLIAVYNFEFLFQLVTMYMLMLSVYKIRKFYRDNKITEELNTKVMVLHVLAFGAYVLSIPATSFF